MNRAVTAALAVAGVVAAGHMVPSVVSLGQWTSLRAVPGGWCRWRGPARRHVALTFDDGPDPKSTPALLDRLDDLSLRATFFCLGAHVAREPGLVREIVARGHVVGSHGHEHAHHFVRSPGWVRTDLERSLFELEECDVTPRWYRPPYGQTTGGTMWAARRARVDLVLWSAWGREWAAPDAIAVADRVVDGLDDGGVVLLHDSDAFSPPGSAARAREALGRLADQLDRRGLTAVTLDDLVA